MESKELNHLQFIYDRLINVHGENENYDYMIRFKQILGEHDLRLNSQMDIAKGMWETGERVQACKHLKQAFGWSLTQSVQYCKANFETQDK